MDNKKIYWLFHDGQLKRKRVKSVKVIFLLGVKLSTLKNWGGETSSLDSLEFVLQNVLVHFKNKKEIFKVSAHNFYLVLCKMLMWANV